MHFHLTFEHEPLSEMTKVCRVHGSEKVETIIVSQTAKRPLDGANLNDAIPLEFGAKKEHFTVREKI